MSSSDIQSKRITGTGSLGVGPARITQIQVLTTTGSPRLTVENGDGGQTVLDLDFSASSTHCKMPRWVCNCISRGQKG